MTTTVMRNSIVGDQWIYAAAQAIPIQRVLDEKTGQPTGEILTGPVRLAFCDLFELPKPTARIKNDNPKFGTMALFHPWYGQFGGNILQEEYYAVVGKEYPEHYDQQTGQYYGLYSPFRKQEEKLKFGGFTPGLMFMTCTSKFKPPVVDSRGNPIIDPSKVYPGVWAVLSINAYPIKDDRKKGAAFGLQSVMLIGDDEPLGGGPADPNKTFGGVKGAIAAPIVPPHLNRIPTGGAPGAPITQVPSHGMPPGYAPPAPVAAPPAPSYVAPAAPTYHPPMPSVAPPAPQGDDDTSWMNA